MSLFNTIANEQYRDNQLQYERDEARNAMSDADTYKFVSGSVGGAILGGTAGAIHKERSNIARKAKGLPISDAAFSHRTALGIGAGLGLGAGVASLFEEENPERDAHRARIKELKKMDQDQLTKERVRHARMLNNHSRSMRKQASEVDDIDLDKYRRQERRSALRDSWSSQSDKEERNMAAGMVAGAGLGLLGAGSMYNLNSKWHKGKTYPLMEAVRRDKLNAFTGTMNGATIGGLSTDFFRDPENTERIGHQQRYKDLKHMTDDELREDYLSKQANEARDYRKNEIAHAQIDASDATTPLGNATQAGGVLLGAAAGVLGGAKLKRMSDKRSSLGHLTTRGDAFASDRAFVGSLAGGLAGGAAGRAVEPKTPERKQHLQRVKDLKHMSDSELLADKANKMKKTASELDKKELKQYQKDEFYKAMNQGQQSVTTEERAKRTAGNLLGMAAGTFAGGKLRHAKDLNRHGMWNTKMKNFTSKEAIIGGIGGSFIGDAVGGAFANENAARDAHLKRMQDVARMTPEQLLADKQQNMHKAASAFFALQDK